MMDGRRWDVAPLGDTADLRDLLGFDLIQLERFADVRSFERTARNESMRNYRYRWIAKRSGGARLIEAPKPILAHAQRTLLRCIVERITPHSAAHGFVQGRSVVTAATPHVGADVVVRLDLSAFFASVPVGRIFATLTATGYDRAVAHRITALLTNRVPRSVLADAPVRPDRQVARSLSHVHLPQGAPTSPAAANLAAFGLDRRMTSLAERFGGTYTRYADDLTISGGADLSDGVDRFLRHAAAIVADEGFRVNHAKTRVMRRSGRQRVLGVVVNDRLNMSRRDVDRLRAELHEAATAGPDVANRRGVVAYRGHLLGRIEWVRQLNPAKAERLRAGFDRIEWSDRP